MVRYLRICLREGVGDLVLKGVDLPDRKLAQRVGGLDGGVTGRADVVAVLIDLDVTIAGIAVASDIQDEALIVVRFLVIQLERVRLVGVGIDVAVHVPGDEHVAVLALDELVLRDLPGVRGHDLGLTVGALRRPRELREGVHLREDLVARGSDDVARLGDDLDLGLKGVARRHVHDLAGRDALDGKLDVSLRGGAHLARVGDDEGVAHALVVPRSVGRGALGDGEAHGAHELIAPVPEDVHRNGDGNLAGAVVVGAGERVAHTHADGLV